MTEPPAHPGRQADPSQADAGSPADPPPQADPPLPAPPDGPPRLAYDGAFIGPMVPPGPPASAPGTPAVPPVTDAVLAIPLSIRGLVGQSLDLLTRSDAGLRGASFYIGLLLLVTVAPVVMLAGLALSIGEPLFDPVQESALNGPVALAALVALAGYLVAGVEARTLALAVIGGRAEGRPLRLPEAIAVARARFWRMLGASLIVGFVTTLVASAVQLPLAFALGGQEAINFGLSLIVGTVVAAPFAYTGAGIVLGEVGIFEAIPRSFRLARTRVRLSVVVALFGILSQFIVLFGVSIGGDVVIRIVDSTGLADGFPPALVIPLAAALVFAFGTLLFLVEAITAAPAVYAFEALTHYTHGLQTGRDRPAGGSTIFSPWFTPVLGVTTGLLLAVLLAGVARLGMP